MVAMLQCLLLQQHKANKRQMQNILLQEEELAKESAEIVCF